MSDNGPSTSTEPAPIAALALTLGRLADHLSVFGDLATDQLAVSPNREDRSAAMKWRNDKIDRAANLRRIQEHAVRIRRATTASQTHDDDKEQNR